jgi:cobalt-zinc-cadmium efflux system outer membrane protein
LLSDEIREYSFDLNSSLEFATKHNKKVLINRYEIDKTSADRITASLRPNPYLMVIGDVLPYNRKNEFDPNRNQYGLSLGFVHETANKREARIELANRNLKVQELVFLEALRQISISTGTLFIETLAANEKLKLAEDNNRNLTYIVEINRKRFAKEDVSRLELIRSEVAQQQYAVELMSARVDYLQHNNMLKVFLGLTPHNTQIKLIGDLDSNKALPKINVEELLNLATTGRPDYLALLSGETAAIANIKLQRANAVPDVTFIFDTLVQQNQYMYGLSLNVPLPVFSRNQGEIAKSEVMRMQTKVMRDEVYLNLSNEVSILERELTIRFEALQIFKKNSLEKSKDAVKIMELAYKGGGATLLDYLDTRRAYNETRLKYIDALAYYEKALIYLKYIAGYDYQ